MNNCSKLTRCKPDRATANEHFKFFRTNINLVEFQAHHLRLDERNKNLCSAPNMECEPKMHHSYITISSVLFTYFGCLNRNLCRLFNTWSLLSPTFLVHTPWNVFLWAFIWNSYASKRKQNWPKKTNRNWKSSLSLSHTYALTRTNQFWTAKALFQIVLSQQIINAAFVLMLNNIA